jgi:lipopolysaccharide transport system permease protein
MQDVEYVIESSNTRLVNWRELWHYRELFYFFTWRDIKVKYKQTLLGVAWALLQPILLVIIFTFFFADTLHVKSEELPYPVFAFSGLIISSGLANAGNSMISNAQIIKKVYFPRLVIPFSSIIASAFDFVMGFAVFIVLIFFFRISINVTEILYAWPAAFLLAFIGTVGPGCFLAALNVKYRDFRYAIPFLIQVLFFLTPVIYPNSMLGRPWLKYVLALNPMSAPIALFRLPITSSLIDAEMLLISITSSAFFLIVGLIYFRRTENYFADLT